MIDRLQVDDFQRVERLRVKLDPKVTAIVGPTDAGKSSVLRAIRWLALNRPRGEGFVRIGSDESSVKVRVDGETVERRKGKQNVYRVGKKELKAFGNDVPDPVRDLLRLSEDNFAGQHDKPFLFDKTAGELAKWLNRIVDLELIDQTYTRLDQESRKNKTAIEVAEGRLREAEEELEGLSFVEEANSDLAELERMEDEKKRLEYESDGLGSIVDEVRRWEREASVDVPDLSELEGLVGEWGRVDEEFRSLTQAVVEVESREDVLDAMVRTLNREERLLEERVGGICPLCGGPFQASQDACRGPGASGEVE